MKIYNTYSKSIEEFKPIHDGEVRIYVCGLTVYDHPHIGNFRTFIFSDVLRRYFEYKGYQVKQIINFTDVGHLTLDDIESGEDKLEQAARRQQKDPWEISKMFIDEYLRMSDFLRIKRAHVHPKATDHIPEMIEMIKKLIEKGYAYVVNGNVYFDCSKFPSYGKLSGNSIEQLKAGARIEINPEKRNPVDYALWKQDPKHIMQWNSPWGKGFPGWHIECSAMSMKYLGETFDIHAGGEDLIFPHHECEIAQSEAFTEKQFVRYWMHARFLLVEGKKMSKSLGNFYTIEDLVQKGISPTALRFSLLNNHYRSQANFTFEGLEAAKQAVDRLNELYRKLKLVADSNKSGEGVQEIIAKATTSFTNAMDDDLNISIALSSIFDFVRDVNKKLETISSDAAKSALFTLTSFDSVLDCLEETQKSLDQKIIELINLRDQARKKKDFKIADKIRDDLKSQGVILKDTPQGVRWQRM